MGHGKAGIVTLFFIQVHGNPITIQRRPSSGKTGVSGTASVMYHFMISAIQMQRICLAREHLSRRFNIDCDIPHLRCLQIPMLTSPRSLVVKQQHTSMSSIQKFVPNPSPGAKKALAPCDPVIWKPGFQSLKNKKSLDNQGIQKKNNSAEDRDRTGTVVTYRRILSPVRLPIPPPRHNLRNATLYTYLFYKYLRNTEVFSLCKCRSIGHQHIIR